MKQLIILLNGQEAGVLAALARQEKPHSHTRKHMAHIERLFPALTIHAAGGLGSIRTRPLSHSSGAYCRTTTAF